MIASDSLPGLATGLGTEEIVHLVTESAYSALPTPVVEEAKRGVLDWLGVTIAGMGEPAVELAIEHVRDSTGSTDAAIPGRGRRTVPEYAAWVSGISGHALDFDDTFPASLGWNFHPSVPVLAAIFSLADRVSVAGTDVLVAYAVGVQTEMLIGAAIGRASSDAGWHTMSTIGAVGAAAACSRALALDSRRTAHALGISASFAGGLRANLGTMSKCLQAGNAARAGVVSALLAQKGFTASPRVLEAEAGFLTVFGSGNRDTVVRDARDEVGWALQYPGLAFKPYPSCRATHASIDAAIELFREEGVGAARIERIVCRTTGFNRRFAAYDAPTCGSEAKFSIPYCVAVALLRGRLTVADFQDARLADPAVRALMNRTAVADLSSAPASTLDFSSEVEMTTREGVVLRRHVVNPTGEPGRRMTADELSSKFLDAVSAFLSPAQSDELLGIVETLERVPDVSALTARAFSGSIGRRITSTAPASPVPGPAA